MEDCLGPQGALELYDMETDRTEMTICQGAAERFLDD